MAVAIAGGWAFGFSSYLLGQTLNGLGRDPNPLIVAGAVTANRTWNDANGDFYPDCLLTNPLANGECGTISNLNLGKPVNTTTYADDVLLDNRNYNWQGSVSLQQELRPGTALNVGYFRTSYGNLQATTNRAFTPADFDTFGATVRTLRQFLQANNDLEQFVRDVTLPDPG